MAEIGEIDLANYLASKGIQTYRAAGMEITAHCWFCPDGNPKGKGKLYFNKDNWLWDCKRCGTKGNRRTLLKHYGDTDERTYVPNEDPSLRRKVLQRAVEIAQESLYKNDDIIEYLVGRGLSADTIERYCLGYVVPNFSLCKSITLPNYERIPLSVFIAAGLMDEQGREWLSGVITIPYMQHGQVVTTRAKVLDGKYFTATGDEVRIFNSDALYGADEVIITEGEFDCLILQQALADAAERGRPVPAVVAIPGAQALAKGFEKFFGDARRVFVALDPDEEGAKATERICTLLGPKAIAVDLPREMPKCDWTEYLRGKTVDHPHGGHDWRDVVKLLAHARMANKRLVSISEMALKWEDAQKRGAGIKLGFTEFDSVIGGFQPGQLIVPAAKTGCIQGDAEIAMNRAGKGFKIKLRDLLDRWEGVKYAWDRGQPTYVQREVDGQVRLGLLLNAWRSGVKTTYTVTTNVGRQIRATDEHPFLTERGWLRLDELVVGDLVHVRGEKGMGGRKVKPQYKQLVVPLHPYAGRRGVGAGGYSVGTHRLVVEASMNGLSLTQLVVRCQSNVDGLKFLDPSAWAVHHIDHDSMNNHPGNLEVCTHSEHAAIHAAEGTTANVQINIALERVVSVEMFGQEETFDLEVADDPHNFLANGFVVHNTGKTVLLANLIHQTAARRQMLISLEMQSAEVYNLLRRIHFFHNPASDPQQILDDYALLRTYDENKLTHDSFSRLIDEYIEDVGAAPELILVDYLGYYARSFRGTSSYERTGDAAMSLKEMAKAADCPLIAPAQVNRNAEEGKSFANEDLRDSGVVEETADFLLKIYRPALSEDLKGKPDISGSLRMELGKSRHGYQGKTFQFRLSNMSLVIVEQGDSRKVHRVEQENEAYASGLQYNDYRRRAGATQLSLVGS